MKVPIFCVLALSPNTWLNSAKSTAGSVTYPSLGRETTRVPVGSKNCSVIILMHVTRWLCCGLVLSAEMQLAVSRSSSSACDSSCRRGRKCGFVSCLSVYCNLIWVYFVTFAIPFGHLSACISLHKKSLSLQVYEGWNFNSGNYLFTTDTK